jgi:hypothetical protein
MGKNSEKRLNIRKNFNRVVCFELTTTEENLPRNIRERGQSIDISSGGLGLRTTFTLEKGSVLRLYLPVDEGGADLPVFSEVVWINRAGDHMKVGLRFL